MQNTKEDETTRCSLAENGGVPMESPNSENAAHRKEKSLVDKVMFWKDSEKEKTEPSSKVKEVELSESEVKTLKKLEWRESVSHDFVVGDINEPPVVPPLSPPPPPAKPQTLSELSELSETKKILVS